MINYLQAGDIINHAEAEKINALLTSLSSIVEFCEANWLWFDSYRSDDEQAIWLQEAKKLLKEVS